MQINPAVSGAPTGIPTCRDSNKATSRGLRREPRPEPGDCKSRGSGLQELPLCIPLFSLSQSSPCETDPGEYRMGLDRDIRSDKIRNRSFLKRKFPPVVKHYRGPYVPMPLRYLRNQFLDFFVCYDHLSPPADDEYFLRPITAYEFYKGVDQCPDTLRGVTKRAALGDAFRKKTFFTSRDNDSETTPL